MGDFLKAASIDVIGVSFLWVSSFGVYGRALDVWKLQLLQAQIHGASWASGSRGARELSRVSELLSFDLTLPGGFGFTSPDPLVHR